MRLHRLLQPSGLPNLLQLLEDSLDDKQSNGGAPGRNSTASFLPIQSQQHPRPKIRLRSIQADWLNWSHSLLRSKQTYQLKVREMQARQQQLHPPVLAAQSVRLRERRRALLPRPAFHSDQPRPLNGREGLTGVNLAVLTPHYKVQIMQLVRTVKVSASEELLKAGNQVVRCRRVQLRSHYKLLQLRLIFNRDAMNLLRRSDRKHHRAGQNRKWICFRGSKLQTITMRVAEETAGADERKMSVQITKGAVATRAASGDLEMKLLNARLLI